MELGFRGANEECVRFTHDRAVSAAIGQDGGAVDYRRARPDLNVYAGERN